MKVFIRLTRIACTISVAATLTGCFNYRVVNGPTGLRIGPAASLNYFPSFGGLVADQPSLSRSSADAIVFGYGAGAEYGFRTSPYVLGLGVTKTRQNYAQYFASSDALYPTRTRGTVDGRFIDGYGGLNLMWGNLRLIPQLGVTRATNSLAGVSTYGVGPELAYMRRYSGWQFNAGVGAEFPIWNRFAARPRLLVSTGAEQPNADTMLRLETGFYYRF